MYYVRIIGLIHVFLHYFNIAEFGENTIFSEDFRIHLMGIIKLKLMFQIEGRNNSLNEYD